MTSAHPTDARAALARALKEQLRTRSLDRITVSGLVSEAGLSRQGFYYHFGGVQDLAVWVFTSEVADHILAHASHAQWADGFARLLTYLRDHRDQTYAVLHSLTLEEFERFFFHELREMMRAIVSELEGDLVLRASDREFVIDHFALTVLGHLLHWIARDMAEDPARLVNNLLFVLEGSVRGTLERFAAETP